jgi:hypothetical protein
MVLGPADNVFMGVLMRNVHNATGVVIGFVSIDGAVAEIYRGTTKIGWVSLNDGTVYKGMQTKVGWVDMNNGYIYGSAVNRIGFVTNDGSVEDNLGRKIGSVSSFGMSSYGPPFEYGWSGGAARLLLWDE